MAKNPYDIEARVQATVEAFVERPSAHDDGAPQSALEKGSSHMTVNSSFIPRAKQPPLSRHFRFTNAKAMAAAAELAGAMGHALLLIHNTLVDNAAGGPALGAGPEKI